MKARFAAMIAMLMWVTPPASGNMIGLYTTPTPTPISEEMCYTGSFPGAFEAYVVLLAAHDGECRPIDSICGFEFSVDLPAGFQITLVTLPPGVNNNGTLPDFDCTGTVTVTDRAALLATLQIGTFSATEGLVYLAPVAQPEIPENLSVCVDDPARAVGALPVSDSLLDPVFLINMGACGPDPVVPDCPVPAENETWSTIKALYR